MNTVKQIFKKVLETLLLIEARAVLKKYHPKIVAVTGSVGKTSTKDAIFSVLSEQFFVRSTSKSFNSEIGIPLTILGLPNAWNDPIKWIQNLIEGLVLIFLPHRYPEWLVVEVGADRPGDIEKVARWLSPDVAVVTRLGDVPVHVEFFDSIEQVRNEKSQLVRAVTEKGTVILNADDKNVSSMRTLTKGKVITYGVTHPANISGSEFVFGYDGSFPKGISFMAEISDKKYPVRITGALGQQQMYSALAALAVADALGVAPEKAINGLLKLETPPGRMRIIRGQKDTCIIDDTYNSSPVAAHSALETLSGIPVQGRKIVVLGDMLELGHHTSEEHTKLGAQAAKVANLIYTVGPRSRDIAKSAVSHGFLESNVKTFSGSVEAGEALLGEIQTGDVVLIKGSQGMRMEKVVEKVMAEPDRAGKLLTRQNEEWKAR